MRGSQFSVTTNSPCFPSLASTILIDDRDINNIQLQIDRARQNYASAVNLVRAAAPPRVKRDILTEVCEEFGPDQALSLLQESPSRFGLTKPLDERAAKQLTVALTNLMDCTETLDKLYASREHILCAADPTRHRHYCIDGRESIIDPVANTLIFVDAPEHAYSLLPVATKDSAALDKDEKGPDLDPERERRRARRR